jgi:hypothetical protein
VKGERNRKATSKLFRKTHMSMASLALREVRAARAPLRAATASILKTSIYMLRESALRSVYRLY